MNNPQEVPTLEDGAFDSINGDRFFNFFAAVQAMIANSPLAQEIAQAKKTLELSEQLRQQEAERKAGQK